MKPSRISFTVALVVSLSSPVVAHSVSHPEPLLAQTLEPQFDSLARQLGRELSKVTTAEVEHRKAVRRSFQKRGYANVLSELLHGDSLGALIAFLKTKLQIELLLPHNKVYVYQYVKDLFLLDPIVFRFEDGTELILENQRAKLAIKEDWEFPIDPWKEQAP